MCDMKNETISHIVNECKKLVQKEYKRRHDNVARIVHWKLRGKYNLKRSDSAFQIFKCHDLIKCPSMKRETHLTE